MQHLTELGRKFVARLATAGELKRYKKEADKKTEGRSMRKRRK